MDIRSSDALFLGLSTLVGAGIAYNSYKFVKRILSDKPPNKLVETILFGEIFNFSLLFRWRKVGEISDLWCFPIKSCGPIIMKEIDCGTLGASNAGHLRDRVFMVARLNGEAVTARTYPKMVRIFPKIVDDCLTVSAPDMKDLVLSIEGLYKLQDKIKVSIWRDEANCIDCGDEAAQWFSKCILGKDEGFRFVFYPSNKPKPEIKNKNYLFEQADQIDTGALHDETSFMLMNQGSFDDLNKKIEKSVGALQYRPNFVVKGAAAWEEDSWKWVKIGKTIFKNVQPCTRCILTNIDPSTGERNPQMEPLKTLKTFRNFEKIASSPVFGIHLGLRTAGKVRMGDQVYVDA